MSFDSLNCSLKMWKSIGILISKVGVHLGVCGLIPSHSFAFLEMWMWFLGYTLGPFHAFTLVTSPKLKSWQFKQLVCRNPNLAKCGGEAQHLVELGIWSPPGLLNVQSSIAGPKTPRIGVFLVSLERSWSVDIENALALGIWKSVAQVMRKRRAESQTGNLTPDH
jgi:hypothetical protein